MLGLIFPIFRPGTVWLVGAGPGDPLLLSLLALHSLENADVVVHDALVDPRILELIKGNKVNLGKRGGIPSPKQDQINAKLIELAKQNLKVVRLKGGDPFIFGRGYEEAKALLEADINFRIVPGITSGTGGLSFCGLPTTTADQQVLTFITGHDKSGNLSSLNWEALAQGSQVLIFYMGVRHAEEIALNLIKAGRNPKEPAAIISKATTQEQQVVVSSLGKLGKDATSLPPPALLVIGYNAALREAILRGMEC